MRLSWIALLCLLGTHAAASPATRPTTKPSKPATKPATSPTTSPIGTESLDHGKVAFSPPDGWVLRGKGADDLSAHYRSRDSRSHLSLVVIVQPAPLPDSAGGAIADALAKKITADAGAGGVEVLDAPSIEKDDRFFVKVHDRTRSNGKVNDRLQIYRREGNLLLTIVSQSAIESKDQAADVHKLAEKMLLGATVVGEKSATASADDEPTVSIKTPATEPAGPTVLSKARLKINSPPPGWKSQPRDAASGIVCTYHQLRGENGMIVVSLRPLPPEARSDEKLRDIVVDEMINGEQTSLNIPRSKETEKPKRIDDKRFVRKTMRKYDVDAEGYTLISRQIVIGNGLLSVASLAPDARAQEIEKLADNLTISTKPLGK